MTSQTTAPDPARRHLLPDGGIHELPLSCIHPSTCNPRGRFDADDLAVLAESIKTNGLLVPLIVEVDPATPGEYLLVDGERRYRAAQLAGMGILPCIIRHFRDEKTRRTAMLVSTLQREDLTPLEEAAAYRALADLEVSQAEIAAMVGRSAGHVSKRLALLKLPDELRAALDDGRLTVTTAHELAATVAAKDLTILAGRIEGQRADLVEDFALHEIDKARRQAQRKQHRAATIAKHRDAGLEVLTKTPDFQPDDDATPDWRPATAGETPTAVYVDETGHATKLVAGSTPLPKATRPAAAPDSHARAAQDSHARAAQARAAAADANKARLEHLHAVLQGRSKPKRSMNDLIGLATPILTSFDDDPSFVIEPTLAEVRTALDVDRLADVDDGTPQGRLRLWLAVVVIAADSSLAGEITATALHGPTRTEIPEAVPLLQFATATGHDLDDLERAFLDAHHADDATP